MENQKLPLTPEEDAVEHIVDRRDKTFLEERFIDSFKGRGVFTNQVIKPSAFVVEYRGNIFCHKDTKPKKKSSDTVNNYLYEFSWKASNWCVDASKEDQTLGRLVNDDHISPNCEMKKINHEGKPHLCLFAVKEISPGEEITYDYGDSFYPWRSTECYSGSRSSHTDFYATSSTPGNERLKDSAAFCTDESCSDDEELPDSGPNHDRFGFSSMNSQSDFRDSSSFTEFDSGQDASGSFLLQTDGASCSGRQDDEAPPDSDEYNLNQSSQPDQTALSPSSDEKRRSRKVGQKTKEMFCPPRNYCYLCGKGMAKISRHLFKAHAHENPDIAKAFLLPKLSRERKRIMEELRNRGNYKHNQEVLKNNSGTLKLRKRSTLEVNAKMYVHCLHCKGLYVRKTAWRHIARCPYRKTSNTETSGRTRVLSEIALSESAFSGKLQSGVWKMLSTMKQDEIAFVIQNDYTLIQVAQYLCDLYSCDQQRHDYIRQKLREMGRLLLALHEKSIFSYEDALKTKNFHKVVETVKNVAGFDEKKQNYEKPRLALKLGHLLKKMCSIVLIGSDGDKELMRETKAFISLCEKQWTELSHEVQEQEVNRPSTIPFTRDVQTFYRYLQLTSADAIKSLKMMETPQIYSSLCRVTLAQVSVLNKGEPEVSKMTLTSFQERDDATKVLSKHFIRVSFMTKTRQNIAVLLTSDLVGALTLLVSKRLACGVHKDNPYLFAKPNNSASCLFHGGICIRSFSHMCSVKNPEHLRSVHFQKHIARIFQILHLENDELSHLSKLLGHDIRADRDYYRSPAAAVELAKIAKLLLAMEKGSLERFKGNSLEEIEIDDELEPDVEQSSSKTKDTATVEEESESLSEQKDDVEQRSRRLSPEEDALKHIKARRDKPFLQGMFVDHVKGRGVFTHKSIDPSAFVVEYRGNIFTNEQTQKTTCVDVLNNFVFDFSWNGSNWRIDATAEDESLGRLVNDDHLNPNCEMRKVVFDEKPHLCLFALKKIRQGEELTYSYSDASYPWRSTETSEKLKTSETKAGDEKDEDSQSADSCSDDDYVPDDGPISDNDESLHVSPDLSESVSSKHQSFMQQLPIDDSFISKKNSTDHSYGDISSDEESKSPSYTKRNYCYVCGKAVFKMARHLYIHRKKEPEIAEVFALHRNSKKRKKLLAKLRNRGNYKHNQKVLKTQRGELKVERQTNSSALTFVPCIYCKGMYGRKDMWRHMRRCPSKVRKPVTGGRTKILTLIAALVSEQEEITPDVMNLLKSMKRDEVATVVQNDSYIQLLAQCWSQINENKPKKTEAIKQRLREMGRLLITLKKKSIGSIEDAVKPENFSKVVEAVKEVAGFDEEKKTCARPSLITKLGNSLMKVGDIKYVRALKEEADKEKLREAETFLKLCSEEWGSGSTSKSNMNKPSTVSFVQDVQLFYQCMTKTVTSAVQSLTLYESSPVYNALLRVVVAQVCILNRNISQVSKLTLQSFKEFEDPAPHEDVSSSQFEQILHKHYVKINLKSKTGRKSGGKNVKVTMTPELLSAIKLLVNKREACGVHKQNPFLFARPVTICMSFYPGQTCISTYAARCCAKNPGNLRTLHFRKYVVRIFQILSLTNEDLDQLAKLLGCDIQTEKSYYQTPEAAADIAKISELLSALEDGGLERFEGKTFDEIEIPDELQPIVQQNEPEDSDDDDDNEEDAQTSPQPSVSSSTKKQVPSSRKRSRGRRKVSKDEVNKEKSDDESGNRPVQRPEKTPEATPSRGDEDTTNMYSVHDEDVNVDFDVDVDTNEDVRNEQRDEGSAPKSVMKETKKKDKDISGRKNKDRSADKHNTDHEETMDMDTQDQTDIRDEDKHLSSDAVNTEKKKKILAVLKQVKILIPKLDIDFKAPVHISQLPSSCTKWLEKHQHVQSSDNNERRETTSNKPQSENVIHMTCSHCKKGMMKGQTAYQKKGFTDVFCSKNCLFEMFPVNKPPSRICYYCHKAITQPQDLIMAAVDVKGTMKDFCSLTCLCSFKSVGLAPQTPPSLCSTCNKSSTAAACELTVNETVHKFCGESCLESFCRSNKLICENCSSMCLRKPMTLNLEDETKTICSENCLEEFKETVKSPQECTMCYASLPASNMLHYKNSEGVVQLFCTRPCLTSYKLWPADVCKLEEKKKKEKHKQSKQNLNIQEESDSDTAELIIANKCVHCSNCGKKLLRGQSLYQPTRSSVTFCSAVCLSERHPRIKIPTKTCFSCLQVITRPHNIILAPVDDSGTMKELCSETCLSSVNAKMNPPSLVRPRSECRMCSKCCYCSFKLTVDGVVLRFCSDCCLLRYHKANNLPASVCSVCSSTCDDRRLLLKVEDRSKNICTEECLVKFKQTVKTPQLCPMCQTSHHMSDMIHSKNDDGGVLHFFCSSRCMMVDKAQTFTVSGRSSPSSEDVDVKDVKPLLNLSCIKEEPVDEDYNQSLPPSISAENIKDEPNVAKEDLKIGSVFSLTGDSPAPTLTHMDLPASCSNCKNILMDGETVYQRKGHADIFCSTSCLLKFYMIKTVKKTCHFCLQSMTQSQVVLQGPVDNEGMKDFCSQACLSSFSYKKVMSHKIPISPASSHSQCSICGRYCISKHEMTQRDSAHKICSNPCFLRYCNMNNLSICDNCHSSCNTPLTLQLEDDNKRLCSAECLVQFKKKIQTRQPCTMCRTSSLMSDMVENKNSENIMKLFCSSSCVMASKIQAVSASGKLLSCDYCGKMSVPACHLALSDASIRNFCTLSCAMAFKKTQKDMTADMSPKKDASDQTQVDLLKPPEKLLCAQCRRIIKTTPKVVQKKSKMNFLCSLSCSQEFKKVNNITGQCEYCKNERIIIDAKRVDNKDCYFCSDGCKMLFRDELEKKWGKHCRSCVYCLSISRTVVMAKYDGKEEQFCSETCSTNYNMLFCRVAKCDTCGQNGKLRQSLPMLGEVKHFCDLKCVLHFCNKKVQMVNAVSSPPRASGSAPVIANVISLANVLALRTSASTNTLPVSVSDVQTKVIGHASVQTVPKEVKNKSMLCTPLVHNKGVSCTTQTVDTEAQTDESAPRVVMLPLPVPVYVPLPLNMYSQYTPNPVGLPLPLPVPVILPVTSDGSEPKKEMIQPEPTEGKLNLWSEVETEQDDGNERKDGQTDRDVNKDDNVSSEDDSRSDPHTSPPPPPPLLPPLELRQDPQISSNPGPVSPPSQQTPDKVNYHNKGLKRQQSSTAAEEETSQTEFVSRKQHKLKSQCGIDAWQRWIQWRESQTNQDPGSGHVMEFNNDLLCCSAAELSDSLCLFISEVKQPDGESYTADGLFYLCLSVQQYLLENDRMENIFSDSAYIKFSTEFSKILRHFKPSVINTGCISSCVEEEFLWECKQLGVFSPIILLNTLLFFSCKYFGFTTVEQQRQLSFAHIRRCTRTNPDNSNTTFLRFYPPSFIHTATSGGVPAKKRKKSVSEEDFLEVMENTEETLRCPVRLYEFYLSKCCDKVRQRTDLFYLRPVHSCVPSSPRWYSSTPLDDSTMEDMLLRILTVRGLQEGERR